LFITSFLCPKKKAACMAHTVSMATTVLILRSRAAHLLHPPMTQVWPGGSRLCLRRGAAASPVTEGMVRIAPA